MGAEGGGVLGVVNQSLLMKPRHVNNSENFWEMYFQHK